MLPEGQQKHFYMSTLQTCVNVPFSIVNLSRLKTHKRRKQKLLGILDPHAVQIIAMKENKSLRISPLTSLPIENLGLQENARVAISNTGQ